MQRSPGKKSKKKTSTLTPKTKSDKKDQDQDLKSELSEILSYFKKDGDYYEVREEQRDLQDSIEFLFKQYDSLSKETKENTGDMQGVSSLM